MSRTGMCQECNHSAMRSQISGPQFVCVRYPPVMLVLPSPNGIQLASVFPVIERDSSCGEFMTDPMLKDIAR